MPMTLTDLDDCFAAVALLGLLSGRHDEFKDLDDLTLHAYDVADAMMNRRRRRRDEGGSPIRPGEEFE